VTVCEHSDIKTEGLSDNDEELGPEVNGGKLNAGCMQISGH
jgi:hypothetical protein